MGQIKIEFIDIALYASDYTIVTLSVLRKDVEKGFDILSDVLRIRFP
jgi:predicted Zn-dependent peptidase